MGWRSHWSCVAVPFVICGPAIAVVTWRGEEVTGLCLPTQDLPQNKCCRRGTVVQGRQRRLDRLQKGRREGIAANPPKPNPKPKIEGVIDVIGNTRDTAIAAKGLA